MEKLYYTGERNHQILISLMKAHNIHQAVVSPGGTNIGMVASLQQDSFFTLYSCIDERSAAYMACGLAAESGEPVAICCTGATAARNYYPAMTEAYYRKLPVLAITCSHSNEEIGHNIPQVTDRTDPPSDFAKMSVYLPSVHSELEEWSCMVKANAAILELTHNGGGPVHINLMTEYSTDFSVKELPPVNVIRRICAHDKLPRLSNTRVAIYVGAHLKWTDAMTAAVDEFCEHYDAVVLCDQTSNYKGKYGVFPYLVSCQKQVNFDCRSISTLIHIGDISGAYVHVSPSHVWRVNPDGVVSDTFKKLNYVFEMDEIDFFKKYNWLANKEDVSSESSDELVFELTEYPEEMEEVSETVIVEDVDGVKSGDPAFYHTWNTTYSKIYEDLLQGLDKIPFSNIWVALNTVDKLPKESIFHLGILSSLRSWNLVPVDKSILTYCNVGGFGIDGGISSLIGASFVHPEKLYLGVIGDLAFFYDLNSLGNRHIRNNVRIMLINNGIGAEFKISGCLSIRSGLGENTNPYVGAEGHYANMSRKLVKDFAEDLGFEYITASNKKEFLNVVDRFTDPKLTNKPVLFEVFTDDDDEQRALDIIGELETTASGSLKSVTKRAMKGVLGEQGFRKLKNTIKG